MPYVWYFILFCEHVVFNHLSNHNHVNYFKNLYDHAPMYKISFCFNVNCNIVSFMYIWLFVLLVLWTILSLMPATSYPKAIGGVC